MIPIEMQSTFNAGTSIKFHHNLFKSYTPTTFPRNLNISNSTVPSNSSPVDPQGPPHWSDVLGDIKVLDFRVQISTSRSFNGTKADW